MLRLNRLIATIDARTGFDQWGPDTNPLIRRIKRQPVRISLRTGLWLTAVIGLIGIWPGVLNALHATTYDLSDPEAIIVLIGWPLSNFNIVLALVYTSLYRLRNTFLLLIALMPLFIIVNFAFVVKISTFFAVEYGYGGSYDAPTYWGNVGAVLLEIAFLLGLLHMNVLAAAVGVHAALKRRTLALTLFAAPSTLLLVMLSPLLSCLVLIAAPDIEIDDTLLTPLVVIAALALMLAPGPVAYRFMQHTAAQWQR
jgi:hypothetical protein